MALDRSSHYPVGRWATPTTAQPQGAFLNETAVEANDRSYLESDWLNDWGGFFGAVWANGKGQNTLSGVIDTATNSQIYDALINVIGQSVPPTWGIAEPLGSPTSYTINIDVRVCALSTNQIVILETSGSGTQFSIYEMKTPGVWTFLPGSSAVLGFGSSSDMAITTLSANAVATYSTITNIIASDTYNGANWNFEGASATLTLTDPAIDALTPTRLAVMQSSPDTLQAYDFDAGGTPEWQPFGNALTLNTGAKNMAAMEPNRVAIHEAGPGTIRMFTLTGSTWSPLGTALASVGGSATSRIVALNKTDVLFSKNTGGNEDHIIYRWSDLTQSWSQVGYAGDIPSDTSGYDLAFLGGIDFVLTDGTANEIRTHRLGAAFGLQALSVELTK